MTRAHNIKKLLMEKDSLVNIVVESPKRKGTKVNVPVLYEANDQLLVPSQCYKSDYILGDAGVSHSIHHHRVALTDPTSLNIVILMMPYKNIKETIISKMNIATEFHHCYKDGTLQQLAEPTASLKEYVIKMGGSGGSPARMGTNVPNLDKDHKHSKNFEIPMAQKHDEKSNSYFIKRCINKEVMAVLVNEQNFNDSPSDSVVRNEAVAENSSLLFLGYYYFTGYHFAEGLNEEDLKKEYGENISESIQQWLQWCMVQHLIFDLHPLFMHSNWKEILKEDKIFH